jgi:hypothetical protein
LTGDLSLRLHICNTRFFGTAFVNISWTSYVKLAETSTRICFLIEF